MARYSAAGAAAGVLTVLAASVATASELSSWTSAVTVEAIDGTSEDVNTPALEGCPIVSPDGRELYFASNRPGGLGGIDIWVSQRAGRGGGWRTPQNVGAPINSSTDDFCPTPVRGRSLYFVSTRDIAGACGGSDIYVARHHPRHGWAEPRNLGCNVNSAAGEASPAYVEVDGGHAYLYFSSNRMGGFAPDTAAPDADIYASAVAADGTFAPAQLVTGVNTTADDARPNLRHDGLELVFDSTRAAPEALGGADLYGAVRTSIDAPWSAPYNLGEASTRRPTRPARRCRGTVWSCISARTAPAANRALTVCRPRTCTPRREAASADGLSPPEVRPSPGER